MPWGQGGILAGGLGTVCTGCVQIRGQRRRWRRRGIHYPPPPPRAGLPARPLVHPPTCGGAPPQIENMMERLPKLRERDDFVSIIPVTTSKAYVRDLPEAELAPQNPDWNAWDYRRAPPSLP